MLESVPWDVATHRMHHQHLIRSLDTESSNAFGQRHCPVEWKTSDTLYCKTTTYCFQTKVKKKKQKENRRKIKFLKFLF